MFRFSFLFQLTPAVSVMRDAWLPQGVGEMALPGVASFVKLIIERISRPKFSEPMELVMLLHIALDLPNPFLILILGVLSPDQEKVLSACMFVILALSSIHWKISFVLSHVMAAGVRYPRLQEL